MTDPNTRKPGAQVIAEQARLAAEPKPLSPLQVWALAKAEGTFQIVDLTTDEHRRQIGVPPLRKTGGFTFTEAVSFAAYVTAHAIPDCTELFADREQSCVIALLNGHQRRGDDPHITPGWGDHRAVLQLKLTPAWKAWSQQSGVATSQGDFAEFLEDHAIDVREPAAADLLEIATTLQATTSAEMKSAVRLENGQVQFAYIETIDAKAGHSGQLKIPTRLSLALAPYEGTDPFRIDARFRYRLNSGVVKLSVLLDRPDDVLRAAFAAVLGQISEATGFPVLLGTPSQI
ncbi:DUF2303 family protein [Synechococcus sp. Cruz-9H2]|uniref:DUF2303 family protein n=1 Tax=unclassified Synechococcus TaxID=2626047 RepID=UPI0020CDDC88|nr:MULTISPECIES: DUF2303 family protein [unclassified Synechococcus]MCP9819835.1 DUF2303 family protein [Synechococcus sp. Cruz-9H2]MCP9844099.1 DUF2303 family protein [Synechococcus sp. Edmonson 11F2]MCP9856265.1 DUF2303 family protein [Synechococcus sp. Cruz-9C9]MCP9863550.1 DUF2303 family protein [Synechococcus sp. Cruz-7E5]MCP9870746.1 DUF2303 family protein [Synechococcus sp. Cruz-7B9]